MAFQAEDYQRACNLAFDGLSANSPEAFATELLDIANDAKFRLQLLAQNLVIVNSEITLIVRGPRVSVGMAPARQTTLMLRRIENLLRIHVEDFLRGTPNANWPSEPPKLYEVFMRPLAEEFAVAFRLGLNEQLHLFGSPSIGDLIIANFMKTLWESVHEGTPHETQGKLARGIARLQPDAKVVSSIEINAVVSGELVSVRIPNRRPNARVGFDDNPVKTKTG